MTKAAIRADMLTAIKEFDLQEASLISGLTRASRRAIDFERIGVEIVGWAGKRLLGIGVIARAKLFINQSRN
ncbi:MAG: hypothetical protein HC930_11355 [Hydrococcus sp. SU_1_0]|nr:hypothetical protein [Hydrococcus sp. SU_1_0]